MDGRRKRYRRKFAFLLFVPHSIFTANPCFPVLRYLGELFNELISTKRYKASQGHLIRLCTMFGVWALFAAGAFKMTQMQFEGIPLLNDLGVRYIVAALITAFGMWFGYRLVHWMPFADFLISVESEMVKVSWPGKAELYSSTVVVLVVFLLLSAMIYVFDVVWLFLFNTIGILK